MTPHAENNLDTIVVGAGLVGAAIACGIAARGGKVAVLDGADRDFRASRGNFGLVWVQGKGADFPAYACLSGLAAKRWPGFAQELQETTGIDVDLQQTGGYDFCLDREEWGAREREMRAVKKHTAGEFEYRMLDNSELRERIPEISGDVLGASYSPLDGHVNPLYLLRALHQRMQNLGAVYCADQPALTIKQQDGHFVVRTGIKTYHCDRVVLCAGLSNQRLAQELGMHVPVRPLRGQLLITDRVDR